ncbi:insoluble matrix shell protein 4-like [Diaphorina citri]|uniref:Insoluble matrix shell protein 4-like n=1 Tax=Diaphorina citri TaxID=121845 RepID=A0A1S3D636_DIACI|nr:insoluble matrix shell protein 4-like [Diaphorina citri]
MSLFSILTSVICGGGNNIPGVTTILNQDGGFILGHHTHIHSITTPCHTRTHLCYHVQNDDHTGHSVFTGQGQGNGNKRNETNNGRSHDMKGQGNDNKRNETNNGRSHDMKGQGNDNKRIETNNGRSHDMKGQGSDNKRNETNNGRSHDY